MKLLGDQMRGRSIEVSSAVCQLSYCFEKLTAQEAIIALDAVRSMVQNKIYEDMQPAGNPRLTVFEPESAGVPLTGSTTL